MTRAQHDAIIEILRRRTEENTRTPEQAREWILRDGIHHPSGRLRKEFVTPRRDRADA